MPKKTENGFTPHITSRKKLCGGFTLIELLVVVAISAVIVVASSIYLGGYRVEQNLKDSASELLAVVKNTQSLSKSEQKGFKWGIHFVNTTSSAGQSYTVFSGVSYASGTVSQTYPLRRNIFFGNPPASSTLDLIFNAVTGYAPYNQIVSLITGRQDGFVNDIIMNTLGQITSKFDTGLVGYWHFDENTSSINYDASGMGNNGNFSTSSAPTWKTGSNCKVGSCLSFNGTNNYVSVADNAKLRVEGGNFTISVWINPSVVRQQVILFKANPNMTNNGYSLIMNRAASDISLTKNGVADQAVSYVFQPNNWYNIVAVQPLGGNVSYYINGQFIGSYSNTSNYQSSSGQSLYMGDVDTFFANKFNGLIDELRIYNRALSATEISDIYNSTR